jgi:hypothetical protein
MRNMLKKVFSLAPAAMMLFSLAGCNGKTFAGNDPDSSRQNPAKPSVANMTS